MSSPHRFIDELDEGEVRAAANIFLQHGGPLRPAWLDPRYTGAGRLALSPLPGLPLYQRSLPADLGTIQQQGVNHIVCLLEDHEFAKWGVAEMLDSYQQAGLAVQRYPIRDHSVCDVAEMRAIVGWLTERLAGGETVMVHCVGGLGRSGIVAACYLTTVGLSADEAIAEVRRTRSPYAIESAEQEEFIRDFFTQTGDRDMANHITVGPIHHLRLTVTDVNRSREFYTSVLGFGIAAEAPPPVDHPEHALVKDALQDGVVLINGNMLMGLRPANAAHLSKGDQFEELRVGLDHLSFSMGSRDELERALGVLDERGVPHGAIKDLGSIFRLYVLAFRDPDNIQLELAAPYS